MSDKELIQNLRKYGESPGPINSPATRTYWQKRLTDLKWGPTLGVNRPSVPLRRNTSKKRSSTPHRQTHGQELRGKDEEDFAKPRKKVKRLPRSNGSNWLRKSTLIGLSAAGLVVLTYILFSKVRESAREIEYRGKDDFLNCDGKNTVCIGENALERAMDLARALGEELSEKAGRFDCHLGGDSRSTTIGDVKKFILTKTSGGNWNILDLQNALRLLTVNPHWGIILFTSDGFPLKNVHQTEFITHVESKTPFMSYLCQLKIALGRLKDRVINILTIVVVCFLLYAFTVIYKRKKHKDEEEMFVLVDGVLEAMAASKNSRIAINYLRDKLIPPQKRKSMAGIWQLAVDWLADNESRLRVEKHRVAGEDKVVWRWISLEEKQDSKMNGEDAGDFLD